MQVREQAEKLEQTSETIIGYLERNLAKIRQARQLIDYYQDAASKLLALPACTLCGRKPVTEENVREILPELKGSTA